MSKSGCIGGTNSARLCEESLAGAFCQMCDRSNTSTEVHFIPATADTFAHCEPCSSQIGTTLALALAALIVVGSLAIIGYRLQRHVPAQWAEWYAQTVAKATLKNKVKIVLGFYMVATKVHTVYGVTMPDAVVALLEQLSVVVTLGVGGFATTPLECLGLSGYVPRLVFHMLFPMVVTAILLAGVCVSMTSRKKNAKARENRMQIVRAKNTEAEHGSGFNMDTDEDDMEVGSTLLENALPPFLQIMFILYPLGERARTRSPLTRVCPLRTH